MAAAARKRVVAGFAFEGVVALGAAQRVGAGVAGDPVGEAVAGAGDVGAAEQHQRFQVAGQRPAQRGAHGVHALIRGFRGQVRRVVHHEHVVAGAAEQAVRAGAAIERVVAGAPFQPVRRGAPQDAVPERAAAQMGDEHQRVAVAPAVDDRAGGEVGADAGRVGGMVGGDGAARGGGAERVGAGEAAQPAPTAANRRRAGDAVGGVGAPDVLDPAQGVDVAPGIGRGSGDEVHDRAPHRQRRAGAQHVVAHGV